MYNQKGNILFLILIAVALFAALSYAVTGTSRTTGNTIESEKAKLTQGEIDSYTAAMNTGFNRLKLINNCSIIDYTPPANQTAGDKSCHIFHPNGGGVSFRNLGLGVGCPLTELIVGEACNGVVYAGEYSGNRMYTTLADQGKMSWNNGSSNWVVTGATSTSDGAQNTDDLINLQDIGAPYLAAQSCRALGKEWYLPSRLELQALYAVRNIGVLNGTFLSENYWSSTEHHQSAAWMFAFQFGYADNYPPSKNGTNVNVRCIRGD